MAKHSSPLMKGSASERLNSEGKTMLNNTGIHRKFYARNNEYRYPSGKMVTAGTPIRQLKNGMVMTGHLQSANSKILMPYKDNSIRKELNIDKNGRSVYSNQRPSNIVKRQRKR